MIGPILKMNDPIIKIEKHDRQTGQNERSNNQNRNRNRKSNHLNRQNRSKQKKNSKWNKYRISEHFVKRDFDSRKKDCSCWFIANKLGIGWNNRSHESKIK